MQKLSVLFAILLCAGCVTTSPLDDKARSVSPGDFVQLSQGYVHYQLEGPETGETVVLVHGFSAPMFIWERTVPALTKAGFRVLSYDLYGRGYSDRPDVAYDKDLFDTQLLELLDALDIRESEVLIEVINCAEEGTRLTIPRYDYLLRCSAHVVIVTQVGL